MRTTGTSARLRAFTPRLEGLTRCRIRSRVRHVDRRGPGARQILLSDQTAASAIDREEAWLAGRVASPQARDRYFSLLRTRRHARLPPAVGVPSPSSSPMPAGRWPRPSSCSRPRTDDPADLAPGPRGRMGGPRSTATLGWQGTVSATYTPADEADVKRVVDELVRLFAVGETGFDPRRWATKATRGEKRAARRAGPVLRSIREEAGVLDADPLRDGALVNAVLDTVEPPPASVVPADRRRRQCRGAFLTIGRSQRCGILAHNGRSGSTSPGCPRRPCACFVAVSKSAPARSSRRTTRSSRVGRRGGRARDGRRRRR